MIETGMTLFVVLALVAFGLFTMFPLDIAARKEQQRLDRAGKYMMMAEETIEASKRLRGAYFAPTAEGALPEAEFVDLFAGQRQNRPLYREEGRIARLDMYGPSGAYRDPLKYALAGERWLLWSLGPDERPDIPATILAEEADAARLQERLLQLSYDPTNGVGSAGDLWLSNINRS